MHYYFFSFLKVYSHGGTESAYLELYILLYVMCYGSHVRSVFEDEVKNDWSEINLHRQDNELKERN